MRAFVLPLIAVIAQLHELGLAGDFRRRGRSVLDDRRQPTQLRVCGWAIGVQVGPGRAKLHPRARTASGRYFAYFQFARNQNVNGGTAHRSPRCESRRRRRVVTHAYPARTCTAPIVNTAWVKLFDRKQAGRGQRDADAGRENPDGGGGFQIARPAWAAASSASQRRGKNRPRGPLRCESRSVTRGQRPRRAPLPPAWRSPSVAARELRALEVPAPVGLGLGPARAGGCGNRRLRRRRGSFRIEWGRTMRHDSRRRGVGCFGGAVVP